MSVTLKTLQNASVNSQAAGTNLPALSTALGNKAKDLPGLVLQTQISMRELERLIEAIHPYAPFLSASRADREARSPKPAVPTSRALPDS